MIATWASQMSAVWILPHSSPTARATASNETITQCCSAFESWACVFVPRHTCAKAVLGTSTSALCDAASLSAAHKARSLRSSAMRAPASRTVRLTRAVALVASSRQLSARLRRVLHARPPTREPRAAIPPRGAFAALRPQARTKWAPYLWRGVRRARALRRKKQQTWRQSYHDITETISGVKPRRTLPPAVAQRQAAEYSMGLGCTDASRRKQ
jgi:hypothetical protein